MAKTFKYKYYMRDIPKYGFTLGVWKDIKNDPTHDLLVDIKHWLNDNSYVDFKIKAKKGKIKFNDKQARMHFKLVWGDYFD